VAGKLNRHREPDGPRVVIYVRAFPQTNRCMVTELLPLLSVAGFFHGEVKANSSASKTIGDVSIHRFCAHVEDEKESLDGFQFRGKCLQPWLGRVASVRCDLPEILGSTRVNRLPSDASG
jgi:hypothetical protein